MGSKFRTGRLVSTSLDVRDVPSYGKASPLSSAGHPLIILQLQQWTNKVIQRTRCPMIRFVRAGLPNTRKRIQKYPVRPPVARCAHPLHPCL